ncbi:hypothetical protein OHO28_08960 [Streptomyces europaeiscabiei]|uniref:hypothetical protein n=1 Tax=Streptomyces europaeiscabiei TaxID=146819 RepID=UPI002E197731
MPQPTWWRQTPRQIQLFTCVLVPTGIALFFSGLWLDHVDWWSGHEFVLNVASSITGLCFGGPIAVLLFNRLGHAQDEARQATRARQRAGEEATAFQQTLLSIFNTPNLADLTARAAALQGQISGIRLLHATDPARAQAMTDFLSAFGTLLPSPSGIPRRNLGPFPRSDEKLLMSEWRTRIVNRWNILHTEVRPGLPGDGWIAEGPATAAQQAVDQLLKAGRSPWKPNNHGENGAVVAMLYFLRDVNALCQAAGALQVYR